MLTEQIFVDPAYVTDRLQLDPTMDGVTAAVEKAIVGAQLQIEAEIGSKFARINRVCLFFLDKDAFSGLRPGGFFRVEVGSGFLDASSVAITFGYGTETDSYTAMATTDYSVDENRGYILIRACNYLDSFVQVTCSTGYTSPVDLPDMLEQAIISYVPVVLNSFSLAGQGQQTTSYQNSGQLALNLLNPYRRTKGFSFRPVMEEAEFAPLDSIPPIPSLGITIGDTTTGAPGSSAAVLLTNGELDFTIPAGLNGASAYNLWIAQGNTGTVQDFLNSLKGSGGTSLDGLFVENVSQYMAVAAVAGGYGVSMSGDMTRVALGIAQNGVNAGDQGTVLTSGEVSNSGWNWIPGRPVFVGTTGTLTQTASDTGFLQIMGQAKSATSMSIQVEDAVSL